MEIKLSSGRFYGKRSELKEFTDLKLTEMSYPGGLRTPLHSHEHAYFSLILEGSHTGTYQGKSRRFTTSTLIVNPA
ncbi:MAG TPA: hypothetical protein VMZ30_17800, partial [Pyrinomonadaceae bacterium]|nr:hypothetical protein [Pyrinomonadaceae bacterium]